MARQGEGLRLTELLASLSLATLLSSTLGRLTGPHIKRLLAGIMLRARHRHTQHEMETFRDRILEDNASRSGGVELEPVSDASIQDAAATALETAGKAPEEA